MHVISSITASFGHLTPLALSSADRGTISIQVTGHTLAQAEHPIQAASEPRRREFRAIPSRQSQPSACFRFYESSDSNIFASLSRRFRALKFWFVVRYFGREGLIARLREHCRLARLFASWVEESADFEMLAPVPFALVCFRACPAGVDDLNALNERIMNEINTSGDAYLSHTKLNGKFTLRLSVGSIRVEERHLQKVWDLLNHRLQEG